MPVPARRLLVIATQCDDMLPLPSLEDAARALTEQLLDPEVGGCLPALAGDQALWLGPLAADRVESLVIEAVNRADAEDATLVLALLGHGFVVGDFSTLYYMGWNTMNGVASTAVDVNSLLQRAVLGPRVNGVVAVIDTCRAAPPFPTAANWWPRTSGWA
ncbi:hypothetical protein ACFQ9X_28305 [Catenulispora yoronensis]